MRIRIAVCAAILLIGFTVPVEAQVRTWVASYGIDTNPCSRTEPCRQFSAALAAVAPDGEVVALDSAGYGPTTLSDTSVTILAPEGVHAAVAPTSGAAFFITGAGRVILRNLFLNSQGATHGIQMNNALPVSLEVHVEDCVVQGFATGLAAASPSMYVSITGSTFRFNDNGIGLLYVRATIDRSRIENSLQTGLQIRERGVQVSNSVISGNATGVSLISQEPLLLTSVTLESSVISHNSTGVSTSVSGVGDGVRGYLSRCTVSYNGTGILSTNPLATVRVSETIITRNTQGVTGTGAGASGGVRSRQDNTLEDNDTDGVFDGTFTTE